MITLKVIPVLLGLFSLAGAQTINYNVINLLNDTHTMGVIVDNVTFPLTAQDYAPILYSGKAPIAQSGYRYVKIEKETNNTEVEPFFRAPSNRSTVNEFFMRSWNTFNLPKLPTVYPPLDYIHRIKSKLFTDGQIATIHLVGNQTEIDMLHGSKSSQEFHILTNMTYIGLKDTHNFEGVEVSLAGRSSRWVPKLSYNVKVHDDDLLYGYRKVKLRALNTDPSYIREQLAYDVIKAVGLASSEFTYCRVFMNDRELGLFGLIDTFKDPWLANVFANGRSNYEHNNLYQGLASTPDAMALNLTSDLSYHENVAFYGLGEYKIKQVATHGQDGDFKPLQAFTKFIHDAPTNGTNAVKKWQKTLNTDSFLRSMALEILLGYADGYLSMADNFYIYDDAKSNTFIYIPSDMDLTQGSTIFSLDPMWSGNYSTFPNIHTRPLMTQILQIPEFKQQFEGLLVNITQALVNPVAMNDRINTLSEMLEQDVAWDQSLSRVAANLLGQMNQPDTSDIDSAVGDALGDQLLSGLNMTVALDFAQRMNAPISLQDAINGPMDRPSLTSVKEWYQKIHENILHFYNISSA